MVDGAMEKNEKPSCIPAPVNQFKGDPAQAFWFFDREMIEATLAYQSRYYDMKPQLEVCLKTEKQYPNRILIYKFTRLLYHRKMVSHFN